MERWEKRYLVIAFAIGIPLAIYLTLLVSGRLGGYPNPSGTLQIDPFWP